MPVDVAAEVIANHPLSADYNVLSLRAPEIARTSAPGQFVMVKAGLGHDPLLRRPFSVFEILRDKAGTASGLSLLNKRIGPSTALVYAATPGQRVACLGPLGRPFSLVDAPAEAWMVAGGVGLAPFVDAGRVASRPRCPLDAVLRRAARRRAVLSESVPRPRGRARADNRGRQRGRARPRRRRRSSAGSPLAPPDAPVMIYACGPEGHAGRHGENRDAVRTALSGLGRAHHGMRPRRLLQLRRADARRARRVPSRAIVSQRAGTRGGSDTVGIESTTTEVTEAYRRELFFQRLFPCPPFPPCPPW